MKNIEKQIESILQRLLVIETILIENGSGETICYVDKKNKKDKQPTYWERVIQGKGTAAKPFLTGEELWSDPEVRQSIDMHNESVKTKNKEEK